jgi:hypothetical protein
MSCKAPGDKVHNAIICFKPGPRSLTVTFKHHVVELGHLYTVMYMAYINLDPSYTISDTKMTANLEIVVAKLLTKKAHSNVCVFFLQYSKHIKSLKKYKHRYYHSTSTIN